MAEISNPKCCRVIIAVNVATGSARIMEKKFP